MAVEIHVVDCRTLRGASDELVLDMPSVDYLEVMETMTKTVLAMVTALAMFGITLLLARPLAIRFRCVSNFCSTINLAVAQMQSKYPI